MEKSATDVFQAVLGLVKATDPDLHQTMVACCSSTSKQMRELVRGYDPSWQGSLVLRGLAVQELQQRLASAEAIRRIGTAVVTGQQYGLQGVLTQLRSCTGLKTLNIINYENGFSGPWLEQFSNLQHLTSLSVELHGIPASVASLFPPISKCSSLRTLSVVAHSSSAMHMPGSLGDDGDMYLAVTQLQQLTQLTLSGGPRMLSPAMVASLTALQNLRRLTLHGDGHNPAGPLLATAFTGLTRLLQLTSLHLVHRDPWDPAGSNQHYLSRGPSPLVRWLAGFTQLLELSVMVKVADIEQVAPLTNLRSLQLIVVLNSDDGDASSDDGDASSDGGDPSSDDGDASSDDGDASSDDGDVDSNAGDVGSDAWDVDSMLEQPLSKLSGLKELDTLWLEAVGYMQEHPETPLHAIQTWGLKALPPALAGLPNLRRVGLPGPRAAALPTTSSKVDHLVLSGARISLQQEDLGKQPGLRTLEAYGVTDITWTKSPPTAGPAAPTSLLTRLVLEGYVPEWCIGNGCLLFGRSMPGFSFKALPDTVRILELTNIMLLDEPSTQSFKLLQLDKLWLDYDLLPHKPYSSMLYAELGLYALVDFSYTVRLPRTNDNRPQSVQIWWLDLYSLELVCSQEKQACTWLRDFPSTTLELDVAAHKHWRAYEDGMLPDSLMESIADVEAAAGRIPGMAVRKGLFPWQIHLHHMFPDNVNVALLLLKAVPAIPNKRTWYRSYALVMQPALLDEVAAAIADFMPPPTMQQAQQLLMRLAEVYTGPARSKEKYNVQVECTGLGSSGCRIDLTFAGQSQQPPGDPFEWTVTGLEQQPVATLGLLMRTLPPPSGHMHPAVYRFSCAQGRLVQRTVCIAVTAVVCLLGPRLAEQVPHGVVQVQGVGGAQLQLLQRLYDAGIANEAIPMPDLHLELSRGQSSHLASEMRQARFLGGG